MTIREAVQLAIGDRVIDRDANGMPSPARVVNLLGVRADEHAIPAVGSTVAEVNPNYPRDDHVVGIRFERRDGKPAGQIYHYPTTRLEAISDEWEPEEPKTNAQRKREETIEQYERKFEAFAAAVHYLEQYPGHSAEWFAQHYDPTVRPETRGECVHSREDRYRPNVSGAICCWKCNGGGRRPDKYHADDPVPVSAPCRTERTRDPSDALYMWFHDEVAPTIPVEQDLARAPNPDWDWLHWTAKDLRAGNVSCRRSAVLRIGYEATVGGTLEEDYNHSKACAYLRDLGVDTNVRLPGGDPYVETGGESQ